MRGDSKRIEEEGKGEGGEGGVTCLRIYSWESWILTGAKNLAAVDLKIIENLNR